MVGFESFPDTWKYFQKVVFKGKKLQKTSRGVTFTGTEVHREQWEVKMEELEARGSFSW